MNPLPIIKEKLKEKVEDLINDENKPWDPILSYVHQKTGIDRGYIFLALLTVALLGIVFGYVGQLLNYFLGIVYPAYASIHAIESRNVDNDAKWLTYWVVFATFTFVEHFSRIFIGWFPMYWLLKCLLLLWLMAPMDANGSLCLYHGIIMPYFLQYHEAVDNVISGAQIKASGLLQRQKETVSSVVIYKAQHTASEFLEDNIDIDDDIIKGVQNTVSEFLEKHKNAEVTANQNSYAIAELLDSEAINLIKERYVKDKKKKKLRISTDHIDMDENMTN